MGQLAIANGARKCHELVIRCTPCGISLPRMPVDPARTGVPPQTYPADNTRCQASRSNSGVEHHTAFDADLLGQIELMIEEIDMFPLAFQDLQRQVARDKTRALTINVALAQMD